MDKICVATTVHQPFDTRIYHKQIRSLQRRYKVFYFAKRPPADRELPDVNGAFFALPPPRGIFGRVVNLALLAILLVRSDYRVYCFHDPELWVVGAWLKLFGKTVIVDLHEDFSKQLLVKEWPSEGLKKIASFIAAKIELVVPKVFDYALLAETSYGEKYRHNYKNLAVVYNYPHVAKVEKVSARGTHFKMVYVGGVTIVRGIMEYLRILKALLDEGCAVRLEIIGGFQNRRTENAAHQFIRENGLEAQTFFHGMMDNSRIYKILSQCQLGLSLLHPIDNYKRSYPTKLFEYMSVGLPALVSNFKLWESVVYPFECGFSVNPFDIDAAVTIVKKYYHDAALQRTHGLNGRRAIAHHFNWGIEEEKLIQVFDEVMGGRRLLPGQAA